LSLITKAGNAAEAIKAVKKERIYLAIVDMLLKNTTDVQVTKKIKVICPNLIVLIFSMSDELRYIKQAFEAGARDYITKDEISEEIVNAIRQILKGQIYISRGLLKNLPKEEVSPTSADRYQNPHFCGKNKESLHYIAFKIFSASGSFAGNTNPR
jgi:DNA-binding NarL/FixJ family response regulator